jgi:hypothetical protein
MRGDALLTAAAKQPGCTAGRRRFDERIEQEAGQLHDQQQRRWMAVDADQPAQPRDGRGGHSRWRADVHRSGDSGRLAGLNAADDSSADG